MCKNIEKEEGNLRRSTSWAFSQESWARLGRRQPQEPWDRRERSLSPCSLAREGERGREREEGREIESGVCVSECSFFFGKK